MGSTRQDITSPKTPRKTMSSTDRSKKRRLDPLKRAAANLKRKNARQLKAKNNPLSTENWKKTERLTTEKSSVTVKST